jgi:threonine dehydrogenase-like Zn-dependent dehydrogenase
MKALIFAGVERVEVGDVEEPRLVQAGDALVEISAAGLCGSDLHPYFGREVGIDHGTVLGHEFVGRVIAVGDEVRTLSVGDRVVSPFTTSCGECPPCRRGLTARCDHGQLFGWVEKGIGLHGAQAERIRVPLADGTLVRVQPDLDDGLALLAGDILSTALYAAELARVTAGQTVAIVGCGPVGLLAVRAALHRGAREVWAVDRVASRLELASRFGATPVHLDDDDLATVVRRSGDGRGADAAIEAVGTASATRCAVDLLRPGGTIAAVGVHTEPHLALSPGELYDRNLTYSAGRCPARRFLPEALEVAEGDAGLLAGLLTHRLPLSEGPRAYRAFGDRVEGWGKVVFLPGGS